jgi:3-hydroxyacyl-[acyl-carrier-protein] dehydratase
MNIQQIIDTIPHRFPFLLVDRVVELELGKRIVALKNVTVNEPFFPGHFPHYHVMPGVLIVEALAQAAAILCFKTMNLDTHSGKVVYFAGIDNARFKRPVVPGDQLKLEAQILNEKRGLVKLAVQAYVEGKLVTEAEILCTMRDTPKSPEVIASTAPKNLPSSAA